MPRPLDRRDETIDAISPLCVPTHASVEVAARVDPRELGTAPIVTDALCPVTG
ncbi:MAG TPA: hypothetical protein VD789_12235 [Thermomicrobiales bacterium]|nr:hypothetical protein [Thermomicrobiales bacterium]